MPPLKAHTNFLTFDNRDVADRIAKEVEFTENVPIDWTTLQLICSSDSFQIADVVVDKQSARCKVMCRVPAGVSDVAGQLHVYARTHAGASRGEGARPALAISLRATQTVDLVIRGRKRLTPHFPVLNQEASLNTGLGMIV